MKLFPNATIAFVATLLTACSAAPDPTFVEATGTSASALSARSETKTPEGSSSATGLPAECQDQQDPDRQCDGTPIPPSPQQGDEGTPQGPETGGGTVGPSGPTWGGDGEDGCGVAGDARVAGDGLVAGSRSMLSRCLDMCHLGQDAREEWCRNMVEDSRDREGCWAKVLRSVTMCEGWCRDMYLVGQCPR